jgi:hypothetical protein
MAACHKGKEEYIDILLKNNADLNWTTPDNKNIFKQEKIIKLNPVVYCLFNERLNIAQILLEKGASAKKAKVLYTNFPYILFTFLKQIILF